MTVYPVEAVKGNARWKRYRPARGGNKCLLRASHTTVWETPHAFLLRVASGHLWGPSGAVLKPASSAFSSQICEDKVDPFSTYRNLQNGVEHSLKRCEGTLA